MSSSASSWRARIDDQVVWGVVEAKLPGLVTEVEALLDEAESG